MYQQRSNMPNIFMVGHSNYELATFLEMLQRENIGTLYDIRVMPFSRYVPQFNQPSLKAAIEEMGIRYIYKKELGPRVEGDEPIFSKEGFGYDKVLQRPRLVQGLSDILKDHAEEDNVAIMATKREPLECHRFLVLTPILERLGSKVSHILPDETLSNEACEEKLIATMHRRIKRKTYTFNEIHDEKYNAYYAQSEKIAKVGIKKYSKLKSKMS